MDALSGISGVSSLALSASPSEPMSADQMLDVQLQQLQQPNAPPVALTPQGNIGPIGTIPQLGLPSGSIAASLQTTPESWNQISSRPPTPRQGQLTPRSDKGSRRSKGDKSRSTSADREREKLRRENEQLREGLQQVKREKQNILEQAQQETSQLNQKLILSAQQTHHMAEKSKEVESAWEHEHVMRIGLEANQQGAEAQRVQLEQQVVTVHRQAQDAINQSSNEQAQVKAHAAALAADNARLQGEVATAQAKAQQIADQALHELNNKEKERAQIMFKAQQQIAHLETSLSVTQNAQEKLNICEQVLQQRMVVEKTQQEELRLMRECQSAQLAVHVANDLDTSKRWAEQINEASRLESLARQDVVGMKLQVKIQSEEMETLKRELVAANETLRMKRTSFAIVDESKSKDAEMVDEMKQIIDSQRTDYVEKIQTVRVRAEKREEKLNNKLAQLEAELERMKTSTSVGATNIAQVFPLIDSGEPASTTAASPPAPQGASGSVAANGNTAADQLRTYAQETTNNDFQDDDDEDDDEDEDEDEEEYVDATSGNGSTGTQVQVTTSDAVLSQRSNPTIMKKARATDVKIPARFPRWNTLKTWMARVGRNLWTASQFYDKAEIAWLNDVPKKTFEELADSGEDRFSHLDALLAMALEKVLPSDLYREFDKRSVKALDEDSALTGRQIVWLIHEYFKVNGHMSTVYGYKHLIALEWFGDSKMDLFMDRFEHMLEHLKGCSLEKPAIRDVLYDKIKAGSTRLQSDLAHFERHKAEVNEEGKDYGGDFTLEYLYRCMKRCIAEDRNNRNYSLQHKTFLKQTTGRGKQEQFDNWDPAAPAIDAGKGGKKGDKSGGNARKRAGGKGGKGKKGKGAGGGGGGGGGGGADWECPSCHKNVFASKTACFSCGTPKPGSGKAPPAAKAKATPAPKRQPSASVGATAKGPCWWHLNSIHNAGTPCKGGKTCKWDHSKVLSKAEFEKLTKPGRDQSKSRATAKKGRGRSQSRTPGGNKAKDYYWSGSDCLPKYCTSYRATNKCEFEAKYPGKTCNFPHKTEAQYASRLAELRKNPPAR